MHFAVLKLDFGASWRVQDPTTSKYPEISILWPLRHVVAFSFLFRFASMTTVGSMMVYLVHDFLQSLQPDLGIGQTGSTQRVSGVGTHLAWIKPGGYPGVHRRILYTNPNKIGYQTIPRNIGCSKRTRRRYIRVKPGLSNPVPKSVCNRAVTENLGLAHRSHRQSFVGYYYCWCRADV